MVNHIRANDDNYDKSLERKTFINILTCDCGMETTLIMYYIYVKKYEKKKEFKFKGKVSAEKEKLYVDIDKVIQDKE